MGARFFQSAISALAFFGMMSSHAADLVLFEADFKSENWFAAFNSPRKAPKVVGLDNVSRVLDPEKKKYVLKVVYHPGSFDLHQGGAYWRTYLSRPVVRATLSYDFKFDPTFDFVLGGKLPGLAGGGKEKVPDDFVAGGEKPTGTNGWSSRLMWRKNGHAENYAYYYKMPTDYGSRFEWSEGTRSVQLKPGKWYHVETQVNLNSPGKDNGSLRTWLDGKPVLSQEHLEFRTVERLKIDSIHFSTFFGGPDLSWAPKKDEYIYFDNFKVVENL